MKASILGLGIQGRSPNVTAQRRLNIYLDVQQQEDRTKVAAYPTPGLLAFATPSGDVTRGIWQMESLDRLFVVQGRSFYEVRHNGTKTKRGTLAADDGAGLVGISDNGTQVIVVTGQHGYIWNTSTSTFSEIGGDFPGADTVTFLDSYFIINRPGTGQFWISGQYDGTVWDGLSFATAEANPDNLVAVAADRGGLALFGSISTELWYNNGSTDFPFSRIEGAPSEMGLAARWSLARCQGLWVGLFRNRQSALTIGRLDGYQISSISTPDLDYLINRYHDPLDAVAFAFTAAGHDFYQITFRTDAVTWLYDATTGAWSQLQSAGDTRHLAERAASFGSSCVVSDYQSGSLYYLDADTYTEDGAAVPREIVGSHLFARDTLNRTRIRRLRLDMESGVGTEGEAAPAVMLQISRDGGHTWGNELWTASGKIGEYLKRAEWRRLGQARDWLFKIRITDPMKVAILGAYIEIDEQDA